MLVQIDSWSTRFLTIASIWKEKRRYGCKIESAIQSKQWRKNWVYLRFASSRWADKDDGDSSGVKESTRHGTVQLSRRHGRRLVVWEVMYAINKCRRSPTISWRVCCNLRRSIINTISKGVQIISTPKPLIAGKFWSWEQFRLRTLILSRRESRKIRCMSLNLVHLDLDVGDVGDFM
jgi:hypothetical protein